jgi:aspartyl/asparaginyl beta-hydroxylase (cupin superfamily)
MQYFKNEQDFPFLSSLKDNYKIITKELNDFLLDPNLDFERFIMSSTAKNAINMANYWKAIVLCVHFKSPIEIFQEYQHLYQVNIDELKPIYDFIYSKFSQTWKIISELKSNEDYGIINASLSYFEPGAHLRLHVNDDTYMYRAHLGLIVPEGNIGFKVCDEIVKWQEGELFVFNPTNPHTAWNLTENRRVIMIVDFFKPDADRTLMKQLQIEQFNKMMSINPWSFGMSGSYSLLDPEIIKKYSYFPPGIGPLIENQ